MPRNPAPKTEPNQAELADGLLEGRPAFQADTAHESFAAGWWAAIRRVVDLAGAPEHVRRLARELMRDRVSP